MGLIARWRARRARAARAGEILRGLAADETDAAFEDYRRMVRGETGLLAECGEEIDRLRRGLAEADELYLTEQWIRLRRRLGRDLPFRLRTWAIARTTRKGRA